MTLPSQLARPCRFGLALSFCLASASSLIGCGEPAEVDAGALADTPALTDTAQIDGGGLDASVVEDAPPGMVDAPLGMSDAPGGSDAPSASSDTPSSAIDPALAGPFTIGAPVSATVMAAGRRTPVTMRVPSGSARHPLVIFLPGFQLTSSQYAGTLERIASHGFVVVGADPAGSLFSVSHVNMAADGAAVLDWALSPSNPAMDRVDAAQVAMMGHSLGGKLSTMVAAMDARVTALLLLDPVNGGAGPAGYSAAAPDIVPDRVTPLTIPIGILGETNNATGGTFGMSCAPAAQNYVTFYDAATMSPWASEWTLTGADHMDFLDNPMCGFTCSVCTDGPGDDAAQLIIARTLAVAFLRRHLAGDAAMEPWLTGSSVPSGATSRHRP